jgi:hypothetical protein
MAGDGYELHSSQPETWSHFVKFVGGTTAVTKLYGPGVSVTYVSTGVVDVTWAENPGTYLGFTFGLHATTVSALKGYTIVGGDYNATTRTVRLNITNSSFALADLAASQWAMLHFLFKQTAV